MKLDSKPKQPGRTQLALTDVRSSLRPHWIALTIGMVLMLTSRVAGLVLPASTKILIDDVIAKHDLGQLRLFLIVVLVATVSEHVAAFAYTRVLGSAGLRAVNSLRQRVQNHISLLPLQFFDSNKIGVLISRIMIDVESIRNIIGGGLMELIGALITATVAVALMVFISPLMTGLALLLLLGYVFVIRKGFQTIKPIFIERGRVQADLTGRLTESLGGIRVVKGYNAEAAEAKTFAAHCQRLLDSSVRTLIASASITLVGNIVASSALIMIIWLGVMKILAGSLTLGQFATFIMLATFIVGPISALSSFGTQFTEAVAGMERIREVFEVETEHDNPARTVDVNGHKPGRVRFENVSFSYKDGEQVLHNISFHAEPGKVIAFVGPSGAGKSTIIGLIAGFYLPDSGKILIDGIDLSQIALPSYRAHLGLVLQDTFLFDGTIRENVAFAGRNASEAEIITACRLARVDAFAERLPAKYDTVVGERGVKLSGGEKQRISIARAILANPSILILDEATSSLDSDSEKLIQESLQHLMQDRTSFVIAHRLSTIQNADQVLVVEAGRIVEVGSPENLYAARGRYYELYTSQFGFNRVNHESSPVTAVLS
jgi:subfamily B ATP-binding cassette protein MsbA